MGTFLASAARCLNEPAVRSADTGADWRASADAFAVADPADASPLPIGSTDPLTYAARAMAALATGRDVLLCNPLWTTAERRAALAIAHASPRAVDSSHPAEPRVLIATGGSSGALRFATHTPATLTAAALALQTFCGGAPLNSLCLLPLHHISGFQQLVRALATGGELLVADWRRLAAGALPVLPSVTGGWMLSLVPTQLHRLVDDPAACAWLRGFGTILLGGAPAGTGLLARARDERLALAIAYGASEFAAALAVQPPSEFLAGTSGLRPLPHATLGIQDPETGAPVAPGEPGRIVVAAPSLFLGYWPETRKPGVFATEDLGKLDASGRLQVLGRADAAINTGGEKVHPAEIEAALRATGAFSEVVVCGAPDPRWGERVVALFPAHDQPDLDRVVQSLRSVIGAHKIPRRWQPVDRWPRTAAGKTDRAALRRRALADE